METLGKLCALGGFAMTLAGQSSPMSGYEHVVSHMLDMSAEHDGRPIASHGSQCGISTVVFAIAWQRLLEDFQPEQVDPDACFPTVADAEARVRGTFDEIDPTGAMADECWSSYRKKVGGWHAARPRFETMLREWPQWRDELAATLDPPETIVASLALAQHPLRYADLGIDEQRARWVFQNGHLMRDRFNSADLLHFTGRLDDDFVDDAFTRMAALVARHGT